MLFPGWLYLHCSVESRPQWLCGNYVNISLFNSQSFLWAGTSLFCAKRRPEDSWHQTIKEPGPLHKTGSEPKWQYKHICEVCVTHSHMYITWKDSGRTPVTSELICNLITTWACTAKACSTRGHGKRAFLSAFILHTFYAKNILHTVSFASCVHMCRAVLWVFHPEVEEKNNRHHWHNIQQEYEWHHIRQSYYFFFGCFYIKSIPPYLF